MPALKYISTRGQAPELDFAGVLLAGLATDGGLYVPQRWPQLQLPSRTPDEPGQLEQLEQLAELPYAELALEIMWPYVDGSWPKDEFAALVSQTYAVFNHLEVVPLVELDDNLWLLELFWGPTLAFKDLALQLVGRLLDGLLTQRNDQITIVGATSGDTGSAAIEACRDKDTIDIFILHPHGRVTPLQRRQMTTVDASNVYNIAVEGSFDDCQNIVKALFGESDTRQQLRLSAVNSINWARVMAQIVYYVWAQLKVQAAGSAVTGSPVTGSPANQLSFAVPTGNFGNVYAGYCASQMAPSNPPRFIVGTNSNDSLNRFFQTAVLQTGTVTPTLSPSMDIMIPSNLERLIFDLHQRDAAGTAAFMRELQQAGSSALAPEQLSAAEQIWSSWSADDDDTLEVMRQTYRQHGRLIDPHTAVGLKAAQELRRDGDPTVVLATAHPAKFPAAVERAVGAVPELSDLPEPLARLTDLPERFEVLPNDLAAVRSYILSRARLAQ